MPYTLDVKKDGDMLVVRVTGRRTRETVWALTRELMETCKREATPKVLIDVRAFEGWLRVIDSYELPTQHFPQLEEGSVLRAAALVDYPETRDRFALFEDVAKGHGYNVRVFEHLGGARQWLAEQR